LLGGGKVIELHQMRAGGMSIREMSRRTGHDRNTVRTAVDEGAARGRQDPPGRGSGPQAIRNGYGVYFVTAHELIEDLRKAYNEQRLDRRLRIYRAPKVLIIDEMGVYAMDQLGAGLFFQLVAARYEKSSIILSSPPRSSTGSCITPTSSTSRETATGSGRRGRRGCYLAPSLMNRRPYTAGVGENETGQGG
jgi:hypothetical protein